MVDLEAIAAKVREDVANLDKKKTNYEKIISMEIGELAEFLESYFKCENNCPVDSSKCYEECVEHILDWLQQNHEGA